MSKNRKTFTNLDAIRVMPVEELAELLVRWDGYEDDAYLIDIWASPNGSTFYDRTDAVEETIDWLQEEYLNE